METADRLDRTQEIVEHLFSLVERIRGCYADAVAAHELSVPQAKTLRYLVERGPVAMREVACRLGCDASNVTGIVDRLEQRGMVERRPAAGDRRVKSVAVTERGAEVAREVWLRVLERVAALVGPAADDQDQLLALLRRLD